MPLNLTQVRNHFPALARPAIFLDNPGGTQIADFCLEKVNDYYLHHNSNHGGAFPTSRESDRVIDAARQAMTDFINAKRPEEIIFGPNMTTLTFGISRALSLTWEPGDIIVVTRLDHDANVSPWVLAARDRGCEVRWVDFNPQDGTLDMDSMKSSLADGARLVAVGYASNALGTINPLKEIIPIAHQAGALVYVDAVQYAPHGPIDVQALDCDFLVASSYKFFGPHLGILYGKYDLLEKVPAYKVRPASNNPPGKFETGTQNHEGIAGLLGALEYFEWVGNNFGNPNTGSFSHQFSGRKLTLKSGMEAIRTYEFELSRAVLSILEETHGITIYGLTDMDRLAERVPTISFTLQGKTPREVARLLGEEGIYVWDGNYYAISVTEQLGLEESGGMVRIGPVHYNTLDEINRFGEVLAKIARD